MEKEIFLKLSEIKGILIEKIKTIEDYNNNKNILELKIEQIENMLKEIFGNLENSSHKKIEPAENIINEPKEIIKQEENKEIENLTNTNKLPDDENNIKEKINEEELKIELKEEEFKEENKKEELNIEIKDEENNEKNSLPKLNFDYDKNINEILNDINVEDKSRPSLKLLEEKKDDDIQKIKINSINNDIIKNISKKKDDNKNNEEYPINHLVKNKNEKIELKDINDKESNQLNNNIKISNLQKNGYSDLFSFNQDLSNINNQSSFLADEFQTKKNKINLNKKDEEVNINNINNKGIKINTNNNTNNTLISEENIKNMNMKKNMVSISSNPEYEKENNIRESKALRVADIIMKINSNDILYDIIIQLYSKDILNQLMSPNVDINLINIIEQTIEKITVLENEEIEKLNNKESFKQNNNDYENNNNVSSKKSKNINNFNKLNVIKKSDGYNNNRTSFSFYDKNNSSYYSQLPPKPLENWKLNKYKAEYLNSEILQNYPKTGKTILGYEKFKRNKTREFNFERSLRNDDNYLKADSIGKNASYHSNNRSFSKKVIFNNYTSPFGDYFDSSLQKGGQSKLKIDNSRTNNNILFKNCRSPVKDYIDGINDVYI